MEKKAKYSKYQEEEVGEVAYGEEVAVEATPEPEPSPVEDKTVEEVEPIWTSYVVKQVDEQVRLQVMSSTLEGVKYMIVPKMYFEIEKTEELVILDDCVLVPIKKQ